ncbi:MAG: SpoIID/LytB domain-containing protein [Lachnospiraceae bacterium]
MKEKIKTFFSVCVLVVAVPYIITFLIQGKETSITTSLAEKIKAEGKSVTEIVQTEELDREKYLVGMIAQEISLNYQIESIKAQAVIARTTLSQMIEAKKDTLPEAMTTKAMIELWGQEGFEENYRMLEQAIADTKGEVLTCQGQLIDAAYHAVSAGKTRTAKEALNREDEPYLTSVDSIMDIPSKEYLKVIFLKKNQVAEKLKAVHGELTISEEDVMNKINITLRDSADYVLQVQIEDITMTGEEFRQALGLNSSCFYIKEVEGQVRIVTKGLGHGIGLSQYGANELAKEGKNYQEILQYYYTGAEITQMLQ